MASFHSFDDNWQTIRPTISDRTKFIFNNELLSDVKFVVPASYNEESESPEDPKSRKCISHDSSSQVCTCNQQSCLLCYVLR